jgi:autotransporter translocation and assembly factor TamB
MTVEVIGFATGREVTEALFRFAPTAGNTLQTSEIRLPVEGLFNTWFQNPGVAVFGSQFSFTQQFSVQGDPNAINLESVTLTNRSGSTTGRP